MHIAPLLVAVAVQALAPAAVPDVAPLFTEWTTATPGCAVGVESGGATLVSRGFGMADLERGVPNRADTIFEAGSVSKQFTAAAVLLLAHDGVLSLDDPVRRYVPELPASAEGVTIRQMLTHTSGLRDWGSVAGIGGWPRTTRAYAHGHVLDILARQSALNFPAGTRWSYSNSGYNLAAIIVARTSGMSFAEFSRRRIFEPAGLTHTSWRDDHTRIVPGRALAYELEADGYHTLMPFENVHGNGGLLTTVGDLLRWTRQFRAPLIGDQAFLTEQVTPGRFADGRAHDYGLGVWVGTYRGQREVRHSGSTAGYRAYLMTFPGISAGVAVLCNAASARAEALAYQVADLVLAASLAPRPAAGTSLALTPAEQSAVTGLYRNRVTGVTSRLVADGSGIKVERGPTLRAESARTLRGPADQRWVLEDGGVLRVTDLFGSEDVLERVQPWTPAAADLNAFAGRYVSDEAETEFESVVDGSGLVLRQRPDRVVRLTPLYQDAFTGSLGTIIFRRNGAGRITGLIVSQDRVWELRFDRRGGGTDGQ
ncbi:MAG: serine hydrolase domain-containing protein [Vicinamibacterales bacterium]